MAIIIAKFKTLIVFILTLITISLCSAYSLGVFDVCFLKNVTEKNYNLGEFLYTGELLNGKFENNGVIKFNDGTTYIGEFKNGGLFGDFTYCGQNDWSICGKFENGNFIKANLTTNQYKASINEKNEINYKNKNDLFYSGQFNVFGQNGEGIFIYSDKSKYIGRFSQGLADENGTFYSKDGKIKYKGGLRNGVFHGFGKYAFGNCTYSGDFFNGLPEGKGTYISKNGWSYEGNFKSGVFDG